MHAKFFTAWLLVTFMFLLTHGLIAQHADKPVTGVVVEMVGDWMLEGKSREKIKKGQTLQVGSRILPPYSIKPTKDYIDILFRDRSRKRYSCQNPGVCTKEPIYLPEVLPLPPSAIGRFVNAIFSLFPHHFSEYTDGAPRDSAQELALNDAVIKLQDGYLTLGQVFKGAPAKSYFLEIRPINAQAEVQRAMNVQPLEFSWRGDQLARLTTTNLRPGLYRLNLLKDLGSYGGLPVTHSWVLVVSDDKYEQVNRAFQDAVAEAKQWEDQLSSLALQGILRAYLHKLALDELH